jgi:ribosome-associated heat shock protein Hsp15
MSEVAEGLRIDVWLWRTRFYKTRSLATAIVSKGRIRVTTQGETRRIARPSALVRRGDVLTLLRNSRIVQVRIQDLPERRGPAAEAQQQYELVEEASPRPDQTAGGE